ncbi:SDR family NAD(P)-dependent oxidoreductase [Salaquimonas pukyongi]|uniref:SDR family NAD(P)-dependent oxidoreductase n=1 Tax=Salaquimonas pukyongi TaxID=2712698 RepID=UPI00096B8BE7|nr:SDR family NAD(P)-dependent oxidoreductase [Salaquimonas pukyongi]
MSGHLAGKTALVTGSVQGIGLAVAKSLAGAGARIAVHGLASEAEAAAAEDEVRAAGATEAKFFEGDLRDAAAIGKLVKAVEDWGPLDVLVNNAGVQKTVSIADADAATWDAIIAVNLSAAFHTMHYALPNMARREFGRVVNIASVHGLVASKEKAPYVASKFGLVGMSRVAALEYASVGSRETGGVTINCICPGWTETALIEPQIEARAQQAGGGRAEGVRALLSEKQPSLRMSDPSEIGDLAAWLCHKTAHNITGAAIPVDGGWTSQ